jgi:hypothetical protein
MFLADRFQVGLAAGRVGGVPNDLAESELPVSHLFLAK